MTRRSVTWTVVVVIGACALLLASVVPGWAEKKPVPRPPEVSTGVRSARLLPEQPRQGGDTCNSALAITELAPGGTYTDSGTTVGYADDYNEICPYDSGSTAPDVVYKYTTTADQTVDLTLCTGTTNYDTKLFVYEDTCPSAVVGCNDDSCSNPPVFSSSWISSLSGLSFTSGHTYYIVVDGYDDSASGDYTLQVSRRTGGALPGETCANPIVVTLPTDFTYTTAVSTSGYADDYYGTCLGYYDSGPDIIYRINVLSTVSAVFTYTTNAPGDWPGMALDATCPLNGSTCLYSDYGNKQTLTFTATNLAAGIYYLQIDNYPSPAYTAGTLTIAPYGGPLPGDTCANAFAIASLPYSNTGTTTGFGNDYTPACSSGTAPDVVYAYTPAATTVADISLCGGSTWDTTLYVYQDSCAGTQIACNDDSCSLQSEITDLVLTAGHTYYIVVDGYGTNSGAYTLNVTGTPPVAPPTCATVVPPPGPPNLLYGQSAHGPADAWGAATSAQTSTFNYTAAESFPVPGPPWFDVSDLHVWGLSGLWSGSAWSNCDPTGMLFDITYYWDNAGKPGLPRCTYTGVAPTISTPAVTPPTYGGWTLYQFDVDPLLPTCNMGAPGTFWVSVKSEPMTPDCAFLWLSSGSGNASSLQDDGTLTWATVNALDLSMCLSGTTTDVVPLRLMSFSAE